MENRIINGLGPGRYADIFLEVEKCRRDAEASLIERVGYALYQLPELDDRPEGFDEEIFDLLFSSADLHNFAPEDKIKYHNDMTTERDIQNQIDFAMDKGIEKGREEERVKTKRFIEALESNGVPKELIDQALSECP
jgi:hypothetical protein